jgi:predicted Zn-dependent peptidase
LDKLGISHTTEELMLQAAISFSYGAYYVNTQYKVEALNNWLEKIFSSPNLLHTFKQAHLKRFKKIVLQKYCGIDPK